ncbi:PVC-type heme-binding CxxCH protein [Halocatena halophila]|uniref:PVC-type heme-binding CxxCH protein n=1 Tax=Halocatena halophila TaxID=2814576 RepID=UPI002ED39A69
MSQDDSGPPETSIDSQPPITLSRRRLLQATGGVGIGSLLTTGVRASNAIEKNVIELEAVQQSSAGSKGSESNGKHSRGPPSHAAKPTHVWKGISPDQIRGTINPTLTLVPGETYTIKWTNTDGKPHNMVIADESGKKLQKSSVEPHEGTTQAVEFTASEEMATYYSQPNRHNMRGSIEFGTVPEPSPGRISVLMLGGPSGGSHNGPARQLQLTEYLLNRGIEVMYTDRLADLESSTLHRYDAWLLYDNRSGLTESQEESIVEFVENGGGFVPIHSASACFTDSDAFIELVGGQFESHGYGEMSTTFERPAHPVLSGLEPIVAEDETYRHTNLNDDITVLAYGDFPDYGENESPEPWSWIRTQGDGRVFYTAWGHDRGTWETEGFKRLIENAIRWVTHNGETIGEDTRTLDPLEFVDETIPYYPPPEGSLLSPTVPEEVGSGTEWTRMQRALDPGETVDRMIHPEGFGIQPFVTEELLPADIRGNIIDMTFDERGRAWLAVTQDYPNELGQGSDSIVICEDTTGDGTADSFTVFADALSIPASLVHIGDGLVVANLNDPESSGQMLYLKDTDGDDVADERIELFSGFGNGDTHAGPNELEYGIDNWIWGQVGYSGFSGSVAGEQFDVSACVYRFKVDSSGTVTAFEVVAELPGNQAGLGFTEEGLAFGSAATAGRPSNYLAIPYRYYDTINGTEPADIGGTADTNRFLPVTDRVRQVDWHGGFTAAAGHTIYTARAYPEKYWNAASFVSDGTGHLLGTFFLEPDGAGYRSHYAHNLVGATDAWFAPTYSAVGPDGMVWFIDWYNYIFQHNPTPDGFENGPGNAYITELRDHATGRLFRVTYDDAATNTQTGLNNATPSELVAALSSENMFWRTTAQQLLIRRAEVDVVAELLELISTESLDGIDNDPSAIHALWTLDGLGALDAAGGDESAIAGARAALTHSAAGVRIAALRVLPRTAETREAILEAGLLTDSDRRVGAWALLSLADMPSSEQAGAAIYAMISSDGAAEEPILLEAASIAGAKHADGFIAAYEENEDTTGPPDPGERPNLLENPSMESIPEGTPDGWEPITYGGTAQHETTTEASRTGEYSLSISSAEGADASWSQFLELEANAEYRFRAWVRTSDDFQNSEDGFGEIGSSYGVTLNVHSLGQDTITDYFTEPVDGFQRLETTFTTGGSPSEYQLNLLFGGWGNANGTVWFDDAELTQIGGFGGGLETVYQRVRRHVELSDGDGDDGSDDQSAIQPGTTIELDGLTGGWAATAPDVITDGTNPTLTLEDGAEYTVEWTNADGAPHDFAIQDASGTTITKTDINMEDGAVTPLTFTVSQEMDQYICTVHPGTMVGAIDVVQSDT